MASMKDIKRRKVSVQSMQQITKAMKVVATVKLQKWKQQAGATKPYFDTMYSTISSILQKTADLKHPYLEKNNSDKKAVIVITGNRGLAGGYNANIVKLITNDPEYKHSQDTLQIYALGRKGRDLLGKRGFHIAGDYSDMVDEPTYKDAVAIGGTLLKAYADGEIGEILLAYTSFKNTISHEAKMIKLLPVEKKEMQEQADSANSNKALMEFVPDEEEVLNEIIPKYLYSLIYGALIEAVASENGARMTAMDSATSNAEDMIHTLSLKYNRARQGAITQELTEIVSGASAIS